MLSEEYLAYRECQVTLADALGKMNRAPQSACLSGKSINLALWKQPLVCHLAKPERQQETGAVTFPMGVSRQSLRSLGSQATGGPTDKCNTPGKGFHETGPPALHQERNRTIHSGHYASAASAVASVLTHSAGVCHHEQWGWHLF